MNCFARYFDRSGLMQAATDDAVRRGNGHA